MSTKEGRTALGESLRLIEFHPSLTFRVGLEFRRESANNGRLDDEATYASKRQADQEPTGPIPYISAIHNESHNTQTTCAENEPIVKREPERYFAAGTGACRLRVVAVRKVELA